MDERAALFSQHLRSGRTAMADGDFGRAWFHLERAHVLSQPVAVDHVRAHVWMLVCGWKQQDLREIAGQLLRLALAAPASAAGRYPKGNTGRANVSAFAPMSVPEDLRGFV
jgi:hypothetical protein